MRIYTFNEDTTEITKRWGKKEAWSHIPHAEPSFKANPYAEIYLENTPRKGHVTAVRLSFKDMRRLLKKQRV